MRAYLAAVLLTALLFPNSLGSVQSPSRQTAAVSLAEFDVHKDGDLLLVPVTLKGKDYLFALDTGCGVTAFDTSLKHLLGEPRADRAGLVTPAGGVAMAFYEPPAASLGRLPLRLAGPVVAADLSGVRRVSGHAVYGLLGMDFLKTHAVRIDFDRGKVFFLKEVGPDPGKPVRLAYRHGVPNVAGKVSGLPEPVAFAADTGCVRYGGLDAERFRHLAERKELSPTGVTRVETLKGVSLVKKGRVGRLSLGGFTHRDLVFTESHYSMLGLPYWTRYVVTFDFPQGVVYLQEGSRYAGPAREDRSGLSLGRVGGRTVVDAVTGDCPAARAGLQEGDELVRLAGRPADGLRMFEMHRLLCAAEGKVQVRVRREGREVDVSMHFEPAESAKAGVAPSR